jgi:acetolactate synthase-1/2/3 large subunit
LVTAGPAVLNTLAALGQAYSDSIPVFLVSPAMPLRHPAYSNGHLHETKDQRAAVEAVVATSYRVTSVPEIGEAVSHAFVDMTAGRPRPVHLEIPIDVLDETAEVEVGQPVVLSRATAPPAEIKQAAALLAKASRPGIVIGGGARAAFAEVRRLAERLGAGVLTTTNGKGILAEDHPLSLGAGAHLPSGAEWARTRDVLLAVGTDLGSSDLWNGPWQLDGSLVRIDIDPRQIVVNARPDVALVSDAGEALRSILHLLDDVPSGSTKSRDTTDWGKRIRAEASTEGALWCNEIKAIDAVLERDAIVTGDSAAVCYYGLRANLPLYAPASFLYPTGYGTLGYGLPAAIGAKIAAPDRQVVAVLGDGGVMFTLGECAAAAAEHLAIPIIVVDNGGYGQIRHNMELRGYSPLGVDIPSPDFAAVGRALGCHGVNITSPAHLSEELAKALVADRPTVLHVIEGDVK